MREVKDVINTERRYYIAIVVLSTTLDINTHKKTPLYS